MMDASGLPLSDLLNRQSLPELLAAVKEVVTGRMGHVANKLREGAALVGGSVAGVDAAAAQRALTEAARGLLSKLPPMPTLEQMQLSEVRTRSRCFRALARFARPSEKCLLWLHATRNLWSLVLLWGALYAHGRF